ncbi:MAG: hypothetical protein KAX61_03135 [Aeromonas sp.]|nr:hypothetical protein [Aeromonas sp.]
MCLTRLRRQDRLGEVASLLADSDAGASRGGLFDDGRQLSALLRRPTTSLTEAVAEALR